MYKDWQEDKEFLLHGVLPFLGVAFASYVLLVLYIAVFGDQEVYKYGNRKMASIENRRRKR